MKLQVPTLCCVFFLLFSTCPLYAGTDSPVILHSLKNAVQYSLQKIDRQLIAASQKISLIGLKGKEAEKILLGLCQAVYGSIDCATVDLNGRMVSVVPGEYKKYSGADISDQEQVKRLMKTGKPVLSGIFLPVEGIHAIDIEYPVFLKDNKKHVGSVSILLQPEPFLASIIEPIREVSGDFVLVIQGGGRILYGKDGKKTGSLLFEDSLYKSCQSLLSADSLKNIGNKNVNSCELSVSGSEGAGKKYVFWDSVDLYGTKWQLLVMDIANRTKEAKFMPGSDRDTHGCIGSAGYSWCESKRKCLRIWEEPCP